MAKERKFFTASEMIRKKHSGRSGVKCITCKRETTNPQLSFSRRVYD